MRAAQFFFGIIQIGVVACNSPNNNNSQALNISDSLAKIEAGHQNAIKGQNEYAKQEIFDSLCALKILNNAFLIVEKVKSEKEYELYSDTLEIRYGNIFSKKIKHLIVKRNFQTGVFIDIFKLVDDQFENVFYRKEWPLTYVGDTIQDVNGDNQKDYLIHWYPMSGCCTRDIFDVYLQNPDGNFSDKIEFINPIFSPQEKIIRGLCYGWTAPLYKYKWNGVGLDTIEFIYFPDSTNGNHFIKRKQRNENEMGQILKELPDEYKKIGYYGNDL